MTAFKRIKRSELYQLVWSEPMSRLARTYGLSDVGLAKVCRRHDIPRPTRGYWARKANGQDPAQTPLPKLDHDPDIVLRDPDNAEVAARVADRDAVRQVALQELTETPIHIADDLEDAHELVAKAQRELSSARTDEHGMITHSEKRVLDIATSKESLPRALLIMDALLKAAQTRGYTVHRGPSVDILDERVTFGISETLATRTERDEEQDLSGSYSFGHSRVKETQEPSGLLVLRINNANAPSDGSRRSWRDTDTRRLEDQLDRVFSGLVATAARVKRHKEAIQKREEEWRQAELRRQEEAKRRAERRVLYKAEKARFDELLAEAANWQKSRQLREYIEAVRSASAAAGPIEPESELGRWITWAMQHADRIDPLTPSPPSILDEDLDDQPSYGFQRNW